MPRWMLAQDSPAGNDADTAAISESASKSAADPIEGLADAVRDLPGFVEQNSAMLIDFGLRLLGVFVLVIVGLTLAAWTQRLTRRALERARIEVTLTKFISRLVRWAVLLLIALAVLGIFGIPTASFAVVLGAAGLAIGLAFQGTLSNFAAGIMLLIFRPFKVGDVVNVAGVVGKVDEIQIFSTSIDTFDNRRFIIPNSSVLGATIENITYHSRRRVDVNVGTAYSADLNKTREILESVATNVAGRLAEEDVFVWLDSLGESSVNWQVRVWAPTSEWGAVKQALTRDIKNALDAAGIGIPFPQRDVHLYQRSAD